MHEIVLSQLLQQLARLTGSIFSGSIAIIFFICAHKWW